MESNTNTTHLSYLSPSELVRQYAQTGTAKCTRSTPSLLVLGVLAGIFIALGGAVTNTASFTVNNIGLARTLSGVLFPFGLCMVVVMGAELFTGNNLLVISLLEKKCTFSQMLRNWGLVYAGNFIGAFLLAALCVYGGQLNQGAGALAVHTIKLAANKCAMSPVSAVILGFLCNFLVCAAVLMASSARDTAGRLMGAFIPICYFIICGFEHSIANIYYISAGLLAAAAPEYAALAQSAGLDLSALTISGFLLGNLLPVTLGNILGGCCVGTAMWFCHAAASKGETHEKLP